jgi:UDP-N-acetylglucosamine 3-dehydrogenase
MSVSDNPEPTKVAVIGLGHIGAVHARLLSRLQGADLAVCCDLDERRASKCPRGARFTIDLDDALDEPGLQAVVVATPDDSHCPPVLAALRQGHAVLCEKPLATTAADAEAMIAAAESSGKPTMVGHVLRCDPRYAAVLFASAQGALGAPIHVTARNVSGRSEGDRMAAKTTLARYVGVHVLDLLRALAGDVTRVHAEASFGGVPPRADTVLATLRFAGGAVGAVELSWALPDSATIPLGEHALAFIGTDACAYVNLVDHGIRIFGSRDAPPGQQTFSYPDAAFRPDVLGVTVGAFVTQLQCFLEAVRGHADPVVGFRDAWATVETALAIDESISTGRPIYLAPQKIHEHTAGQAASP